MRLAILHAIIAVFLLSNVLGSTEEMSPLIKCISSCNEENQVGCRTGCQIAQQVALAACSHEPVTSCTNLCEDVIHNTEKHSCIKSCQNFKFKVEDPHSESNTNDSSWMGYLHKGYSIVKSFFKRVIKSFWHSSGGPDCALVTESQKFLTNTHIPLSFSTPTQDDTIVESTSAKSEDLTFHPKAPVQGDSSSPVPSQPVVKSAYWVHYLEVGDFVRQTFSIPITLIFASVVLVLLTLLIVQIMLYTRRRNDRFHGHQFATLPTYAEAVGTKTECKDNYMEKVGAIDEDVSV